MHYSERLLAHVKRAEQATQAAKEHVLRDYGITPAQQSAMAILSDHDGITAAELARKCAVTPQTMTSTLGRLEKRGLVERTPHPVHGTLIEVRLTQHGKNLFDRADAQVTDLDEALARPLTASETATLKSLLAKVTETASRITSSTAKTTSAALRHGPHTSYRQDRAAPPLAVRARLRRADRGRVPRWPHVSFTGRIAFAGVTSLYELALATILLLPDRYARAGQMTQRIFESVLVGCLPPTPAALPFASEQTGRAPHPVIGGLPALVSPYLSSQAGRSTPCDGGKPCAAVPSRGRVTWLREEVKHAPVLDPHIGHWGRCVTGSVRSRT